MQKPSLQVGFLVEGVLGGHRGSCLCGSCVQEIPGYRHRCLTTTSYSLPPSETEDAQPRILWNLPYRHNPFFTGREHVLERLRSSLVSKGQHSVQPQAISGLGGIGKTQLATKYAYRYRQDYEMVLWAEADSEETLISSLTSIAHLLNLPVKDPEDP